MAEPSFLPSDLSGSTSPPVPRADPASELTAQKKFSCPLCGGEALWDPAKQALVCMYCGTASPAQIDAATGTVEEHDLAAALRDVPDSQRGWMTETRSVRCQSCQAISVFPAGVAAQRCAFCGSSALVDYTEMRAPIRPESLMAFRLSESQVREAVRDWYGSRWFAPNRLKKAALTDKVHGFYLPFWTFDAQAHCHWTADAGYYYYTTESYRDSNGREQTRQVRHTRWEPASGTVDHFFNDELVAASRGVPADLIEAVEPFPTLDQLVPYEASYLSGWVVEQYQIDLKEGSDRAERAMNDSLRSLCSQQVPGDTQRGLAIYPSFSDRTFKHILLPVWVLSYNYVGKPFQVLVNGYTGKIAGNYPKSWIKITLLIIAILIVVVLFFTLTQHHQR